MTAFYGLVRLEHMPFLPAAKMNERQKLLRKLAAEGKTYAEIGALVNLSRQRVHQLLTGYKSPFHSKIKAS